MEKSEFNILIDFFNKLQVTEEDVTTVEEVAEGQLAVVVTYHFEDKKFRTKKLYYKDINFQGDIKDRDKVNIYFGQPVFWLDIRHHNWPKPSGEAEIEKTVINDMIEEGDLEFEKLLKSIANDAKTGFLQLCTKEGRRNTYGYNLENNNHWHDLILLIKSILKSQGNPVDKYYFKRLVYEWARKGAGRTSLSPDLGTRSIVQNIYKNVESSKTTIAIMDLINLLKIKPQIILEGPPGTGKTHSAKEVAYQIIFGESLAMEKVARQNGLSKMESTGRYKIIQFHPAYSYEDFVRGISTRTVDNQIEYRTENRLLAAFAETANKNYENSKKKPQDLSKEKWARQVFDAFKEDLILKMVDEGKVALTPSVYLFEVEEDAFRYAGEWKVSMRMKFEDLISLFLEDITERIDIVKNKAISSLARSHATYFKQVLDKLRLFATSYPPPSSTSEEEIEPLQNYVLIIDEINRANLPAVLGELIYALEYRGEALESMYDLDGNRKIVLPPNLLIIGTMNTADRSVGHIDYAIRRRFAFVPILPDAQIVENMISEVTLRSKALNLFNDVKELFVPEHLASDFEPDQVQLGHSYFLADTEEILQLKLKYEIQPILREYLKDGILQGDDVKEKIELLHV